MTVFCFIILHLIGFLALKSFSNFPLLYSPTCFSFNKILFSPVRLNKGDFLLTEGLILTLNLKKIKYFQKSLKKKTKKLLLCNRKISKQN